MLIFADRLVCGLWLAVSINFLRVICSRGEEPGKCGSHCSAVGHGIIDTSNCAIQLHFHEFTAQSESHNLLSGPVGHTDTYMLVRSAFTPVKIRNEANIISIGHRPTGHCNLMAV